MALVLFRYIGLFPAPFVGGRQRFDTCSLNISFFFHQMHYICPLHGFVLWLSFSRKGILARSERKGRQVIRITAPPY